jgi:ATP-binding cassette subfamily B protein
MPETSRSLGDKLRKAAGQLPYLPRTLALVWTASGKWTTAWVALLVIQGLLPAATVYLTRAVVDRAVPVFRTHGDPAALRAAVAPAVFLGAVLLMMGILRGMSQWVRTAQAELVQDHISTLIHRQSAAADLAFYETPDFFDHLHRARAEAAHRPLALLETLGSLLQNGITLAAMGAVLIPYGLWLPVALLTSTLPALWVVLRYSARQHQWRLHATADERQAWYYDWLLTASENAPELRLFGLGEYFQSCYQSMRSRLRRDHLALVRAQSLAELGAGAAALAITAAAMVWMVWRAIGGFITLGELALFYQAFQQGLQLLRSLLENAGQVYANMLFLGNLFEFLALSPKVVSPPAPKPAPERLRDGIRFTRVRFRYPGSANMALDDFDLFVPAGSTAAIVGRNGAGKSTLLKLLCRFYDPEDGRICLDGIDLRELSTEELRRRIAVLFQQPVHYNATAAQNIALGDLRNPPSDAEIRSAARAAGADTAIDRLPLGYDNLLGKWFADGAELSVGEWQRIALARAFVRRAPILILDEPTSAMDPWAEADWLDRFRRLAAGHTAIVITHRFTTARLADAIHVMEAGRIAESGTHQELIDRGGRYAAWWDSKEGPGNLRMASPPGSGKSSDANC